MSFSPSLSLTAFPLQILARKKQANQRIAMISLHDATAALLACEAGADVLLVGDSLGNTILGLDSTIGVTLDDMVRHTQAVSRGAKQSSRPHTPIIADLPFATYHGSPDSIAANGAALMRAGAHAVKLEGAAQSTLSAARLLIEMGAPVCGHLGFTPQSAGHFAGVVQGKSALAAQQLLDDAKRLRDIGCCAVVLEVVPLEVAQIVTQQIDIATIGIGAGVHCDGQVLVWQDLIGLTEKAPRFARAFSQVRETLQQAARDYVQSVHDVSFPAPEHAWPMNEEELQQLKLDLGF